MNSDTGQVAELGVSASAQPQSRRRFLWGFLIMLLAGVGWFALRSSRADAPVRLEVAPESLDFGEAWSQVGFEWDLPIHNPSGRPVDVSEIRSSCGCTAVKPESFTVGPAETVDVRLVLDLTSNSRREVGASEWPFSITLAPFVEDVRAPVGEWELSGTVRKLLEVTPGELDFSQTLVRGQPFSPRQIRVQPLHPIQKLSADCDPELGSIVVRRSSEDENVFELDVRPSENLPIGRFRFAVSVKALLESGSQSPMMELPVYGSVVHDVQVKPGAIFVGPVALGERIERTFSVVSRTGKSLSVKNVHCDSGHVEIARVDESTVSGSQYEYRVSVAVKNLGHCSTEVCLNLAGPEDGEAGQVIVPVTWYGLGPPQGGTGKEAVSAGKSAGGQTRSTQSP